MNPASVIKIKDIPRLLMLSTNEGNFAPPSSPSFLFLLHWVGGFSLTFAGITLLTFPVGTSYIMHNGSLDAG